MGRESPTVERGLGEAYKLGHVRSAGPGSVTVETIAPAQGVGGSDGIPWIPPPVRSGWGLVPAQTAVVAWCVQIFGGLKYQRPR